MYPQRLSAFAVSISVGNKISVGHAQYTGSANLTAVAQASSNGQATVTCSASVSSSAIAARIIQATASVSDSGFNTPAVYHPAVIIAGYWVPAVWGWVGVSGSGSHFTRANGSYVYGLFGSGYRHSNTATSTWYQGSVRYDEYYTEHYEETAPTYYVNPVTVTEAYTTPAFWTITGYTPNAQVVVSDVTVLSGSFAYPTASAEVTATGTRVCIGIADVTSAASATSTAFKVRHIDASGVHFDATADLSLSVTVDILGSAQVLADAEATAESFRTVFASGAFSGSSLAISVGNKKAVGQTDIVANASVSVASSTYVIFDASAAINPSVTMSAVGDLIIITAGLLTATATASIDASAYLSESVASASVNAGASGFADGDTLIGATARVADEGTLTEAVYHPAVNYPAVYHPAVIIPAVITPGYWVPAVWAWVGVSGAGSHFTTLNGSYVYGLTGSGYRSSNTATTTWYQGSDIYREYYTEHYEQTAAAYYVNPVTVSPEIIVSAAYTVPAYTVAAYTVPAFYTYTGFAPRANTTAEAFIQFSFSLTASSELSATAGAIHTASAQISASADTTAASHIESAATCTLNGTASISPVNTNFLVFTSAALSASSDVVSLADKEIYGKADVVGTADIAVSGTGINAAFGYPNAAASVVATAFRMRVPSPVNAIATAELVSSFTFVSQTGERSNGILILVEAEVRSIAVEAGERIIIVDAEDRTIFAEAA